MIKQSDISRCVFVEVAVVDVKVPNKAPYYRRYTTAKSTKTSPQNITLHYRKNFVIIPSRSHRTMWEKYPKMNERITFVCSRWGTAILRVIFIELCRRVRVKFPKSSADIHKS